MWKFGKICSSSAPALFRKHQYRHPTDYRQLIPKTYLPPIPVGRTCTCTDPPPGGGPCVPAAVPALHDPLGSPVRLSSQLERLPDRSPGRLINLQIAGKHPFSTDRRACRATHRGTRRGVCFATHAPATVIQTVVHFMLQNRFAAFRTRRVAGKHKGKANSRVRHSPF